MPVTNEIVVDALPYIDQGYDEPGVREAALQMVEEETRRFRPTKNYLEHMPPLKIHAFETEIIKREFDRIQHRLPKEPLSMRRYELPTPPPGKMNDINSWSECVSNSHAQLEHQALRISNLELMVEYGTETWKAHLEYLEKCVESAQNHLVSLRKQVQEVNWHRKKSQMEGGEKMKELESSWVSLVSKNYEIEQACAELQKELYEIKTKKLSSKSKN